MVHLQDMIDTAANKKPVVGTGWRRLTRKAEFPVNVSNCKPFPDNAQPPTCPICEGKHYTYTQSLHDIPDVRLYSVGVYVPCPLCAQSKPQPTANKPVRQKAPGGGFVYLVKMRGQPWFKIGVSGDVDARITSLNTSVPTGVDVIVTYRSATRYGDEQELHKRFADKRLNGEWFALDDDDVAYIKSLAVQK